MAYCPKCKSEYEEHVSECVDCGIELVPDLENHVYMKPLIKVKRAELSDIVKYLEYSNIETIETKEDQDGVVILVDEKSFEPALEYMKVYIHENMEEHNDEDYYFDEYETEVVDRNAKVSDMKSTVYTFGFMGALLLVIGVLNYIDVIALPGFDKTMISAVLSIVGIIFVGIAIKTYKDMDHVAAADEEKEAQIQRIVKWYKEAKGFESFYSRHKIKRDEIDEGALYFVVYDLLKKEVKKEYADEGETIINAAVEIIYEELS